MEPSKNAYKAGTLGGSVLLGIAVVSCGVVNLKYKRI